MAEANSTLQLQMSTGEEDISSREAKKLDVFEVDQPKDEDSRASKKIHQFYFVKFWSYKNPDEGSRISEAKKLIKNIDREILRTNKKYMMLERKRSGCLSERRKLGNIGPSTYEIDWKEMTLDYLQLALDKLNSEKIAHKGGPKKIAFSTERNTRGFKCRMLHGSRNLAAERQLLGEISRSKQSVSDLIDPKPLPLQDVFWYNHSTIDKTRYTQLLEMINKIEERKVKSLTDAIVKGEPWNPLSAKRATLEQIKLVNKISVELRREQGEMMPAVIESLMKDVKAIDEEMKGLTKQLRALDKRKVEAENTILNVRQQFDEMDGWYKEYLSLSRNARELARIKEVEAPRKVSHGQVNKFMSRWNDDRTFRINYEISVKLNKNGSGAT